MTAVISEVDDIEAFGINEVAMRTMERREGVRNSLNVFGPFTGFTGYGLITEQVALGLKYQCGIDVRPYPINFHDFYRANQISYQIQNMIKGHILLPDIPTYFHCDLDIDIYRELPSSQSAIHFVYESDTIPWDWVPTLNRADFIVVPSTFLISVLRDSGVDTPIHLIPEGIDALVYQPRPRAKRQQVFTFGVVGPFIGRKNNDLVVSAFKKTFGEDPRFRLYIQGSYGLDNYQSDQPNIIYRDAPTRTRTLMPFYESIDCLVAVGSEGFGLPLLEALAVGCPVIALNSEGQKDHCDLLGKLVRKIEPWELVPHEDMFFDAVGNHWRPNEDDLSSAMIDIVEDYDVWMARAAQASPLVLEERSIWGFAPKLVDLLRQYDFLDKSP